MARLLLSFSLAFNLVASIYAANVKSARDGVSIPSAQYSVSISGKVPRTAARRAILTRAHGRRKSPSTVVTEGANDDSEYLVDMTVGGQTFKVIIDTGSTTSWVPEVGFQCTNLTSFPEPPSVCFPGTGFDPSQSPTFQAYPNHTFFAGFGSGEFLSGTAFFDTVTVGDLTVKNQVLGLASQAAFLGDGVSSGLLGFAFPALGFIHNNGTDTNNTGFDGLDLSPPFFPNAVDQNLVPNPFFSVALDRGSPAGQTNSSQELHLGYLSFGGVALVPTTKTAVTLPALEISPAPEDGFPVDRYWWLIALDTFNIGNKSITVPANTTSLVDTGNPSNSVPDDVAAALAAACNPPATLNEDLDTYFVDCNATAPSFSVQFGSKTFNIDPRDLIVPAGNDDIDDTPGCILGFQPGGQETPSNQFSLGDPFLHNVVATFNVQSNELTFAERIPY